MLELLSVSVSCSWICSWQMIAGADPLGGVRSVLSVPGGLYSVYLVRCRRENLRAGELISHPWPRLASDVVQGCCSSTIAGLTLQLAVQSSSSAAREGLGTAAIGLRVSRGCTFPLPLPFPFRGRSSRRRFRVAVIHSESSIQLRPACPVLPPFHRSLHAIPHTTLPSTQS